jgi:hypothetical protein
MRATFALFLVTAAAACGPNANGGDDDDDDTGDGGAPDASDPTGDGGTGENVDVYAHTAGALYRVDPETYEIELVGNFQWPSGSDSMTDIAIDKNGRMVGISYSRVYEVNPASAGCTLLSGTLQGMFNGLSFVPSIFALGVDGDDVLVGARNTDGKVFRIDPATGVATELGDMGGSYTSSGDIVAVNGFGMVATVPTGTVGPDQLVRLEAITFAATPIGTHTGFDDLWGVGFWKGKIFGFSEGGELSIIDSSTGSGVSVDTGGEAWWGAAVTTAAPVVD